MRSLIKRLEVNAPGGGSRILDSEDLRATPPERCTWNKTFFNLFWLAAVTNVSVELVLGLLVPPLGVTFWEGVGCATAGYAVISLWMIACGRPGARWNASPIGFPVVCRSSFGIFGAGWPALNRAFMACVWQGVNAVSGAQALYVCLVAIFPSFSHVPVNTMGSGSALTSAQMICYFIFVLINGALCFVPVHRWHSLVYLKLAVYTISSAGMLALAITQAGSGVGPVVMAPSKIHGSAKSWLLIRMILTSAASCSTFASNALDWQRNATKPNDPIIGQLLGFPLANLLTNVIGMLVASCSEVVYGKVVWMPTTFLAKILDDNYTPKICAGTFFIALGFLISLLYSAQVENVYPCGNDLAALAPRFITIKRGFFLCLAISCVINPWYLLGSASRFVTVLSSYQIFHFSIAAIIMADYFIVSKGFFIYEDLYHSRRDGAYWGSYLLFNWASPTLHRRERWSEPKGLWVPPECQLAVSDDAASAGEDKEKDDPMAVSEVVEVPRYELRT